MAQDSTIETNQQHPTSKSKKNKKRRAKAKVNGDNSHAEDTKHSNDQDNDAVDDELEPDTPIEEQTHQEPLPDTEVPPADRPPATAVLPLTEEPKQQDHELVNGKEERATTPGTDVPQTGPPTIEPKNMEHHPQDNSVSSQTNDSIVEPSSGAHDAPGPSTANETLKQSDTKEPPNDAEERLAAAARERDELRLEVTELRKSLESIQQQHEDKLASLKTQVEDAESGKEHAEVQYKTLLGKVNTIRAQLGERLKADAEDLTQARTQIEELEEQNRQSQETTDSLQQQNETLQAQNENLERKMSEITKERDERANEVTELRYRASTTQQNWISERDDLIRREALAREEFETARQAMQDWEVLAMEERSIREGLGDRVAELEEQLAGQQQAYERAATERDDQSSTVDGLQRALHDIQEARKQELRETVETYQTQLEDLRKQLKIAEEASTGSQSELDALKQNLERALPFEKEVKEKNLLIGKLRHEAVILNDHLTKALKYIKRSKPDDTVDKQLITNHLLQFLALDRSDPKRFQILQIMSAILAWTEEQQESAGLARPGASHQSINPNHSLRLPLAPFVRRVSSSASFHQPMFSASSTSLSSMQEVTSPSGKESLSELWSGFLEREAMEGSGSGSGGRRLSTSSAASGGGGGRRDMLASPGTGSPTVSRYALPKMEEDEAA